MWYIVCLLVWILNVLDGILTLRAMSAGSFVEINPIMDYVLVNFGDSVFFYVFKVGFPALAMTIAAYGVYVRSLYIKRALAFVFCMYFCVTLWHIYLMAL